MRPIRMKPIRADEAIALSIARHTWPAPEALAKVLTWGADEKILLALAAVGWLATRDRSAAARRTGDHALLVTATVALLPHLLKCGVNQTRPDRLTLIGHLHGIPISGRAEDAFPSGHALHIGALASAATPWPKGWREAGLAVAIGLSLTRVAVLAHWTSDVITGFVLGALVERALRRLTGYARHSRGRRGG